MHLDEEQIQRALHGELAPSSREDAERHLAACASCRARLDQARREEERIVDLLSRIDHPMPTRSEGAIALRAARRPRRWEWIGVAPSGLRWAAAIILVLAAAGVAYTAPGSPVRGWVDRIIGRSAPTGAPRGEAVAPEVPAPDPSPAGISVVPGARFSIRFASPQDRGKIAVSLIDGTEIVVRTQGGSAGFRSDPDRLVIENLGATADYDIRIPAGAPWVEIFVGDARVLLKDRDRIATRAVPDAQRRYIMPLAPPSP